MTISRFWNALWPFLVAIYLRLSNRYTRMQAKKEFFLVKNEYTFPRQEICSIYIIPYLNTSSMPVDHVDHQKRKNPNLAKLLPLQLKKAYENKKGLKFRENSGHFFSCGLSISLHEWSLNVSTCLVHFLAIFIERKEMLPKQT